MSVFMYVHNGMISRVKMCTVAQEIENHEGDGMSKVDTSKRKGRMLSKTTILESPAEN